MKGGMQKDEGGRMNGSFFFCGFAALQCGKASPYRQLVF